MIQSTTVLSKSITKHYLCYVVVYAALVLFFVSDGLNKIIYVNFQADGISDITRAVFEALFIFLLIFHLNKNNFNLIIAIFCLFITFIIGQFFYYEELPSASTLFGNFKIFNKYIFIFLLYPSIKLIAVRNPDWFNKILELFYTILLVNSVVIIIGFVLDISIFRSYPFKLYRFGFSGLIPKINEATLFCFISISFIYYRRYTLNLKYKKDYLILCAPLLLGSKGIYFYILLLLFYHVLSQRNKILTFCAIVPPLLGIASYFLSAPSKLHYFIQQGKAYGWFSMLLSRRDVIFEEYSAELLNDWTFINYLFGGQDQTYRMFEMDFFDLFFFFGLIGSTIYLFLIFSTIFNFSLKNRFNLFVVGCYVLLAFSGGHFFASAVNALYMCIFTVYIKGKPNAEYINR